jgi:ribosome-associated protein
MSPNPVRHITALGPQKAPKATRGRARDPKEARQIRKFAVEAARLAADLHCENILLLDVRGLSDVTDYLLIASGTSQRQILSVAERIEELAKEMEIGRLGHELESGAWVVIDFVDVVAHLFDPPVRAHYDLEMLWGDAKLVRWRRQPRRGGAAGLAGT